MTLAEQMTQQTYALYVTADDLAVQRQGQTVLSEAAFELLPGNAMVLRGANGAGKTSLLRAIAGFARYTGDLAFSDGETLWDPAYVRAASTHYISHENGLARRLTVAENIQFLRQFLGSTASPDIDIILFRLELTGMKDMPAGRLSAGQQRRLGLAKLLLSPRALWLLDEPAAALDRTGVQVLDTLVRDHRAAGGIAIVSAHEGYVPEGAITLQLGADTSLLTGFADSAEFDVKTSIDQFVPPPMMTPSPPERSAPAYASDAPLADSPFARGTAPPRPNLPAGSVPPVTPLDPTTPKPSRVDQVPVPGNVSPPPETSAPQSILPPKPQQRAADALSDATDAAWRGRPDLPQASTPKPAAKPAPEPRRTSKATAPPPQKGSKPEKDSDTDDNDGLPDIIPEAVLKMMEMEKNRKP